MKRYLSFLLLIAFPILGKAQNCQGLKEYINKAWDEFVVPEEGGVQEILDKRKELNNKILSDGGTEELLQENGALALHQVAALYEKDADLQLKKNILARVLKGVDLRKKSIVQCSNLSRVVEDYYFLQFVREGVEPSVAKGGMFFNTSIPTVGNDCDYERYRRVLKLNNPDLILDYLTCLKSVFRYNGCTSGMEELRPLIEKFMPEGELKESIKVLYKQYAHLREGMEAPAFTLKDFRGKSYSLEDFKGKVLIVDVWATWCGGCIAKLPSFLEMKEEYAGRTDIEFITISIDKKGVFNKWKYTLPRLKLMGMVNLLAPDGDCDFSKNYNITGIPRYFLIDKAGKIVTVYAPAPGKDFRALIDKVLNAKE